VILTLRGNRIQYLSTAILKNLVIAGLTGALLFFYDQVGILYLSEPQTGWVSGVFIPAVLGSVGSLVMFGGRTHRIGWTVIIPLVVGLLILNEETSLSLVAEVSGWIMFNALYWSVGGAAVFFMLDFLKRSKEDI
jgi:hypothetical protein